MVKFTVGSRLRYWFDNMVSRGSGALIGLLAAASALVILLITLVGWLAGIAPGEDPPSAGIDGFLHLAWMGLMRTLDAGTMGGDQGSYGFLALMLAFTFAGICVVSLFIGLLTSGIENKIAELRKGRSFVPERDHHLILGWSPKVFTILDQLIEANQHTPRPRIVVLAEQDKVEMEDAIRARVRKPGRVRVICRTGSPIESNDLAIVNPDAARAIIVLSPEDADPDAGAIKTVLALVNNPRASSNPRHIVAELRSKRNIEVVKMVGGSHVEAIDSQALIARMMVQTCRHAGLSAVYSELLDFGGVEFYFAAEPHLTGKRFGEALMAYEHCSVIGIHTVDGRTLLKPPVDTPIGPDDKLIVIAEDDRSITMTGVDETGIDVDAITDAQPHPPTPDRTLILGWNARGPIIVNELDAYAAPGSAVTIVADMGDHETVVERECDGLKNLTVHTAHADTTDRDVLDRLGLPAFHHVILLCYSDYLEPQRADARTLVTLLHLRRIAQEQRAKFSIVSEMLDIRNRQLAETGRADDFIVSDRLVSLLMAQVAQTKELNAVFEELFTPQGAEIYLRPAGQYVQTGREISYRTVVASARKRGEAAIGYRKSDGIPMASNGFGVVLNPAKSSRVTLAPDDRVIVVAEG